MTSVLFINDAVKDMTEYVNKSKDQEYPDQQLNHELILNLSHENLNVPQSNMTQEFNKQSKMCWHIVNRHTILIICTIILASSYIFFQVFESPKVLENSRNIELMKKDMEELQRQLYEANFLNEFEAFEKQLYGSGDNMSGDDVDIDENDDYNYGYEDYELGIHKEFNEEEIGSQIISTTLPGTIEDLGKLSYNITQLKHTNDEKFNTNIRENNIGLSIDQLAATSNSKQNSSNMNRSISGQPLIDFKNLRHKRYIRNDQPLNKFNSNDDIMSTNYQQGLQSKPENTNYKYLKHQKVSSVRVANNAMVKPKRHQYYKKSIRNSRNK